MTKTAKATGLLCAAAVLFTAAACGPIGGVNSSDEVTILTSAVVGTPTDANDPYRQYIKDNYGLNATLVAATDFATTVQLRFSDYASMPDIVSFQDVDSFRTIFNQGVLLGDWTPYLEQMPNFATIVNTSDADRPNQPSVARMMMTEEGKLTGLWTLPDPPSWSLKIREDWADEFRATAEGKDWQPATPNDLLSFARWIRTSKNSDPNNPTVYGFATAGEQTDFGVLGTWIPLMYGAVTQLPYGIYFTEGGEIEYGITDGTHKKMLDFIKTLIDEKLINPNWYYTKASDKNDITNSGRVGIEWYPGEISENTQAYFNRNNKIDPATGEIVDTSDWWQTYPVPKDPESPNGGYQASDGFLGQIITVSAKAANDTAKMQKICRFLNDLAMTKTVDGAGKVTYNRSAAYNALRWGVGIEEGLQFQSIPNSAQVYLYTGDEGKETRSYRSQFPGAWDWGAFFRSTDDGVVQGTSSAEANKIVERVIEQDALTANYARRLQYGGVLKLDTSTVSALSRKMQSFEYRYVTGTLTGGESYAAFSADWLGSGGTDLFAEAKKQFRQLNLISG